MTAATASPAAPSEAATIVSSVPLPNRYQHASPPEARISRVGSSDDDNDSLQFYDGDDSVDAGSSGRPYGHESSDEESLASSKQHQPCRTLDTELLQELDREYDVALEEREIAYQARHDSVRGSACFLLVAMAVLLILSVLFLLSLTDDEWDVGDAALFCVYAITTVGYGNLHNPQTPAFQMFVIVFVFTGIAALTVLAAQIYQWIALEAARAQINRDSATRHSAAATLGERISANLHQRFSLGRGRDGLMMQPNHHRYTSNYRTTRVMQLGNFFNIPAQWMDLFFNYLEKAEVFFKENEIGRGISVVFPFGSLILVGAMVVGICEEWTMVESVYFSVISLTTVGFGDYYPTQTFSIWFCVFWLPFSIGFMSLYLTGVAAFYIRLSDQNILRIERQIRKRMEEAKKKKEEERRAVRRRALRGQEQSQGGNLDQNTRSQPEGSKQTAEMEQRPESPPDKADASSLVYDDDEQVGQLDVMRRKGFDTLPAEDEAQTEGGHRRTNRARFKLFGRRGVDKDRRSRIKSSASVSLRQHDSEATMRDVLHGVHVDFSCRDEKNPFATQATSAEGKQASNSYRLTATEYSALRSAHMDFDTNNFTTVPSQVKRKPSFALRALVQERLAEIIASDVAGYQDSIEIQDHTMSVSIRALKETAIRWKLPRRTRRPFRSVAFEVLFFLGEYALVTRGADALFDLSPIVFHGLFAPLLASFGEAEAMEDWLIATQVTADADLTHNSLSGRLQQLQSSCDEQHQHDPGRCLAASNQKSAVGAPLDEDEML